ncbi:MAG: type II toxin-antitoxin system prevent-host-death family antitoxin [Thermoleophilia bacterium]|jgi:prevent-host-death family protein
MDVSVYEAKTHLSRLIGEVEAGVEVTITRHGKPVARLVPIVDEADSRAAWVDRVVANRRAMGLTFESGEVASWVREGRR